MTKPFFKYCKRCDNRFKPMGRAQKLCDDCYDNYKKSPKKVKSRELK